MSCFLSLPSFYGQSSSLPCTRSWSYCSSLVSCTVKPNSSASSRSAYTAKYCKEIIIITELTSFNLNSWPRTSNAPLILPGNHYNISLIHLLCRYSRWPSHLIPFLQAPITLTLLPVLPDKKKESQSDVDFNTFTPSLLFTANMYTLTHCLSTCPSICALDFMSPVKEIFPVILPSLDFLLSIALSY